MSYIDNLMRKFDARQRKLITSKWTVSEEPRDKGAVVVSGAKDVVCRCESEDVANHIVAVHNVSSSILGQLESLAKKKPVVKKKPVKAKKPVSKK